MKVKEQIAFNALHTPNISESAMFRLIQGSRPTLLYDEAEQFGFAEGNSAISSILLSGRGRDATVVRMEKDQNGNFKPVFFRTSSPCVMANIRGISDVALENRSIKLILRPFKNKEVANRDAEETDPIRHEIRQKLYVLLMTKWQEVQKISSEFQEAGGLSGRDFGLWKPILIMAKFVERYGVENIFDEMLSFAQSMTNDAKEDHNENDFTLKVFQSILTISSNKDELDFYPTNEIYLGVKSQYGVLPEWLTEQKIKFKTNRLAVGKSKRETINGETKRGYWINKSDLKEQIERSGFSDSLDGFDSLDELKEQAVTQETLPSIEQIKPSEVSTVSEVSGDRKESETNDS